MKRIALLVTAAAAAALGTAAPVSAHVRGRPAGDGIGAVEARQERSLSHARYVCRRGSGHVRRWHCAAARWTRRELAETRAKRVPYAKWACIHRHEGAWNDPDSPYWGGLQMDWGFMRTYGADFMRRWGTADKWPVWAQITAAERAYHGYRGYGPRGFTPWPNTARACGL